jgi:hypothetical protein
VILWRVWRSVLTSLTWPALVVGFLLCTWALLATLVVGGMFNWIATVFALASLVYAARWRFTHRGLVAASREFKAQCRRLREFPTMYVNPAAGFVLIAHSFGVGPVRWRTLNRAAVEDLEAVWDVLLTAGGPAVSIFDQFGTMPFSNMVSRRVDGFRARLGPDDVPEVEASTLKVRLWPLLRDRLSGAYDADEDDLREVCAQLEGARPIPPPDI